MAEELPTHALDDLRARSRAEWGRCFALMEDVSRNYASLTGLMLEIVTEIKRRNALHEQRLTRLEEAVFGKAG